MASELVFEPNGDREIKRHDFPKSFVFGVGTSAYQVEGGWNKGGRGLSIWDTFTLRRPDKILGGANGCITVDKFSKMKEDVQLLKKMGVKHYRFSLSWPRILPGGKICLGKNVEAINYYNSLIDELLANDIEPFVTIFHWDLPNALEEEYLGFLSSKIVDDFVNYADLCFWEFGDRVKNWVTLNEPYRFTYSGYVAGTFAPGRGGENEDGDPQTEPYTVAYNLLNCHAAAYRKYHEDYKGCQKGRIGITLDSNFYKPYRGSSNQEDVKAVGYALDFMFGWFMEPLTSGTWPQSIQKFVVAPTKEYPKGRALPQFSAQQREMLIHSYDFLGINYYTSSFAQLQNPSPKLREGYVTDCHFLASAKDPQGEWIGEPAFEGSWLYLCPNELTELLFYIKKTYNVSKEIIITENGSPEKYDPLKTYEQVRDDTFRLNYIKEHLKAIRTARHNNINVTGYFAWSFMDSFEWRSGYSIRFGMIYVDYVSLTRLPKKSAIWFKSFLSEEKKDFLKRGITETQEEHNVDNALTKTEPLGEVSKKLKKIRA